MNPAGLMHTLPGRVLQKFMEDQAPNWAVLIAWNALFALFPIVVFMAAVLGIVAGIIGESRTIYCHAAQSQTTPLDCTLLSLLPSQTVPGAFEAIHHFQEQKGLLILVGVVGLLWGGSALFGAMEQAFAVIYHTQARDFTRQKVMGVSMILLFTLLGGLAVASSLVLPALPAIPGAPALLKSGFSLVVQVAIGLLAGFLLFASIYYVVPNRPQDWRKVLPGAALAGVLFELVSLLFPSYIALTNSVATYGKTFGLFFVVLTFFSFLGLITMVGVEVNSVLYPVRVDQPLRGTTLTSAPPSGRLDNGKRSVGVRGARVQGTAAVDDGQAAPSASRGIKPRTAVGLAVAASVIGVVVGRRTSSS